MRFLRDFRLGRLLGRRNDEIQEEIGFYLEERAREMEARGFSPEEARRRAAEAFGDVERITGELRRMRGAPICPGVAGALGALGQDIGYVRRTLLRSPGFTVAAVLTLSLGIGASTALYTAVDTLVLGRLPVPDPDRLVLLGWSSATAEIASSVDDRPRVDPVTGARTSRSFSAHAYERLREAGVGMSEVFAFARIEQLSVTVAGEAEVATGQFVTGGYYAGLGVAPAFGRGITDADERAAADPVVVLSHGYWERRFGGDPAVVGRSITLNGRPFTVAGVSPAGFHGTLDIGESPDLTVPLALEPALRGGDSNLAEPFNWWLFVMGRLTDSSTAEGVRSQAEGIFQSTALEGWAQIPADVRSLPEFQGERAVPRLEVHPGNRGLAGNRSTYGVRLRLLGLVVGSLLLIACANVAGLLLVRSEARHREIAIRGALGASRARVARQLMTEGLAIALMGAVMGALIAYWAQGLLAAWVAGGQSAPAASSTPDLRMLAFCVALSLASGVLLSAAPALSGSRAGSFTVRGATRGPSGRRPTLRGALTVAQVSLSFALLTVAGLLIGTLRNLEREDLGFDPEGLLLFRMDPRLSGYPGPAMFELYETLAERLEALPGVRSATLSRHPLLAGSSERTGDGLFVHAPGQEVQEGVAHLHRVRWNFFETMEMPLLSGRAFTASDDRGASLVAIVNEAFAATYYPGRSPVGGRFSFGHPEADAFEIVGVVGDAKYTGQRDAVPPTVYVHYIQAGPTQVNFAVRADGDPTLLIPGVRAAIREVAPDLPIFETRTQSALAEARLSAERRLAWTSSLVGLAALLLTCVALYGTVSSRVSRRTPEIGVRIALGASRRSVLGLVLAETAALVVTGIFAGALLAQASTRLLVEQLFHVSPNAADVRLSAALVMLCVGVLAAYVPAIRAARVDPMVALRND